MRLAPLLPSPSSRLSLAGCGSGGGGDGRPTVVATTTQAADLARDVAGDRAEVRGLLAPNSDPHDYEVRPGDVKALARATLVVRSGGDLDEWLGGAIDSAGADAPGASTCSSAWARGRATRTGGRTRSARRRAVTAIGAALAKADPEGASTYARQRRAQREPPAGARRRRARCIDAHPGRAAHARHDPRRARLLRATATACASSAP